MARSSETDPTRATRRRLLTALVAVIVVSFALAAAGITVLIIGPEGDLMSRVLVTTLIVGGFSVGALSCLALWGRAAHTFGVIGAAVNAASAVVALLAVWVEQGSDDFWRVLNRLLVSGLIISAAWALASLLLLLSRRRRSVIRVGLIATLVALGITVALAVAGVWWDDLADAEIYPRVLGTLGILSALGVVVVPVLALLLRDGPAARGPEDFPADVAERLIETARARGITVAELVAPVLGEQNHPSEITGRADHGSPDAPPTLEA